MNIKSKQQLEEYFNENQRTILFPILVELYREEKNYIEAKKICEIGLKHHPNNSNGLFQLALTSIAEKEFVSAETLLKRVLTQEPNHYNAAVNLAKIQTRLKRAKSTVSKTWKKVLEIDPTNQLAENYFKKIEREKNQVPKKTQQKVKTFSKLQSKAKTKRKSVDKPSSKSRTPIKKSQATDATTKPQRIEEEELTVLDISPRMATFTMVNVLKKQKLYQQALLVLNMLEEKGADSALIEQERQNLEKLLKEDT